MALHQGNSSTRSYNDGWGWQKNGARKEQGAMGGQKDGWVNDQRMKETFAATAGNASVFQLKSKGRGRSPTPFLGSQESGVRFLRLKTTSNR